MSAPLAADNQRLVPFQPFRAKRSAIGLLYHSTTSQCRASASPVGTALAEGVVAARIKGATAQQPPRRHPTSSRGTVRLDRLCRVRRAGGIELAERGEGRRDRPLIKPDERQEKWFHESLVAALPECLRSAGLPLAFAQSRKKVRIVSSRSAKRTVLASARG